MIDTYILLNRKPKIISWMFSLIISFLTILVVYILFNYKYTIYKNVASCLVFYNNSYFLKVSVLLEDSNIILRHNEIIIDGREYKYEIYKVVNGDDFESQDIYLKVYGLDNYYLIDGYEVSAKIMSEDKIVIEYFKEGVI